MTDALTIDDDASAAVAVAPRVSKDSIEAKMARVSYFSPAKATGQLVSATDNLKTMTICIIEMQNGFTVTGESAPASPENFNEDLGKQFAYENAFRKLWPLEGYLLRERLHLGALEAIAPPPAPEPTAPPEADVATAPDGTTETDAELTTDAAKSKGGVDTVSGDAGNDTVTGSAALADDPNTAALVDVSPAEPADTDADTTTAPDPAPAPKGK